jgi:photosystem II stability/assembly factor-like uncharacterized protein
MRIHRVWLAAVLPGFLAACAPTPVTLVPPKVPEGGRALSIAVRSNDAKRIVVASESGGLFQTFDGGKYWLHLDAFPNYKPIDVASASLAPDVVIATAQSQYRKINDGGIWRGTADGANWIQPPGWAPAPGPGCTDRPSAYGISHMPLTRTFFVGTDCGLAVSNDDGVTWTNQILDPSAAGSSLFKNRIHSVLVINRTSGVAVGDGGLFFLSPSGVWIKSSIDPDGGQTPPTHCFSAPWWNGSNIFFKTTIERKLLVSTDSGANWSEVSVPNRDHDSREAFVRVARSVSNDDSKLDIYFGDGYQLFRQTVLFSDPAGTDSWTELKPDHPDPNDIAFGLEQREPLLLATDGGVHLTGDQGASWTLSGAGSGFNSLQITEVTGQSVTGSSPHLDLYYATQDNGIRASPDGGHTWLGEICGEGRFLRTGPTSVDHKDVLVTGTGNGCTNFVTDAHFQNVRNWPNAPDGNAANPAEAPFPIVNDAYIQNVANSNMPPAFDFFLTLSAGAAWTKTFSLQLVPKGIPLFSGFLANPTIFQGVLKPGAISNGGLLFGLMRASNLAGQAAVVQADGSGMGAVGSLKTPIARYVVFGVDPNDPNHLIAPDVENGAMKFSTDGGMTWHPLPQLTNAVTGNGAFLFQLSEFSLASVVAWDPYDSCHILVGTMENGIIRSTDGGSTWTQIPESKAVTFTTSFYFPPAGAIWVSTNGRGLWTLSLDRQKGGTTGRCHFPDPPTGGIGGIGGVILDPINGSQQPFRGIDDPALCSQCSVVVVRNGWVTDIRQSGDAIQEIAISGGTISQLGRSGREIPLAIPNAYRSGDPQLGGRFSLRGVSEGIRVRGLIVEGSRLRSLIISTTELPFTPLRVPMVYAFNSAAGGSTVWSGKTVRVVGTNFLPSSQPDQGARILFDDKQATEGVEVGADGSFKIDLPLTRAGGEVLVTVEQRDGRRLTRESTLIEVPSDDR